MCRHYFRVTTSLVNFDVISLKIVKKKHFSILKIVSRMAKLKKEMQFLKIIYGLVNN